ncbi:UNVERIFIED_CONTAM: Dynein regulatory complex protein 8 [Gekko kuhli]
MATEEEAAVAESIIVEIQKGIMDAFEMFDHECNKTVGVRETGTIIGSLGCCPSEGDLPDMLAEVEEEEPTGFIRLGKCLPMMTRVLMERRYRPIPEDILLCAFEVLDQNKCGHLTKEELVKYMTQDDPETFFFIEMKHKILRIPTRIKGLSKNSKGDILSIELSGHLKYR